MSSQSSIYNFRSPIKRKVSAANLSNDSFVTDCLRIVLYYSTHLLIRKSVHALCYLSLWG